MKNAFRALLAAVGLSFGCSKATVLDPGKFTNEYARYLRQHLPDSTVEIVQDLELKVTPLGRPSSAVFLDNAYAEYRNSPKSKADIIKKFAGAALETVSNVDSSLVDRTRLVAVIKDRPWLKEIQQSLAARGAKKPLEMVHEDLNSDLIILYAEDSAKNMRYITPSDLQKAHIDQSELRALAIENLKRIIPKIERHGANGLYMLAAGGDYEASLLLIDSIWIDMQNEVHGDVVVCIPTRDLLIVTGSDDFAGIEKVKQIAQKAWAEGSYKLTPKLFVYRAGKFSEFASAPSSNN
jgi:uncharacterized protein YtpQ (UPF0354 family)